MIFIYKKVRPQLYGRGLASSFDRIQKYIKFLKTNRFLDIGDINYIAFRQLLHRGE